jgi:hypothetical protein
MMLSGGKSGKLVLKGRDAENIFAGLDIAQEKYRLLVDEEASLDDITNSIAIPEFDRKFSELFRSLTKLMAVYRSLGMITDSEAAKFSDLLIELCRTPSNGIKKTQATFESAAAKDLMIKPYKSRVDSGGLFSTTHPQGKRESSTAVFIRYLDY